MDNRRHAVWNIGVNMSEFLTTDGQGFSSLGQAQANVAQRCAQRDGFHLCFVQEVRQLDGGVWQHFENFSEPSSHAAKFEEAAEDAVFCVYNPLTGENAYCQGKEETLTLVESILAAHAVATGLTTIYQNTHEADSLWPYAEVQA
jgi:hypothetical protein